jgi:hypothetical protein
LNYTKSAPPNGRCSYGHSTWRAQILRKTLERVSNGEPSAAKCRWRSLRRLYVPPHRNNSASRPRRFATAPRGGRCGFLATRVLPALVSFERHGHSQVQSFPPRCRSRERGNLLRKPLGIRRGRTGFPLPAFAGTSFAGMTRQLTGFEGDPIPNDTITVLPMGFQRRTVPESYLP